MENPSRKVIKDVLEKAKVIAIVGLSDKPHRTSYQIAEALLDSGYDVIPVNPEIEEVFGIKALDAISELPDNVDIINVFRRSEYLPDLAKAAVETNVPVFWAQLGVSHEGAYDTLTKADKTVIMDRCIKVEHAILIGK
ncbi:CoA-binding protein [Paenalkalicoccus suaedae]|uniref:CoA-binding protein n=1 Tax=Paenalkalicoccus suaedae TaxID=2592382 RepID=A0A859FGG7_9BACI|nr:CoA-binding protein [Paenalkalicoccus suaedae]QKS71295.1 CoA-binding protein [Paenalkalicoccus suaedae]